MVVNCTIKKRPRRAFGKRPPAPRKPKGKPGRPFVGAHGEGSVKQGKTTTKTFKPWRILAIRNWDGAVVQPHALLGAATGLVAHFRCGLWGWLANVHSRRGLRACVARIDRRVTGEQQVCLRTKR